MRVVSVADFHSSGVCWVKVLRIGLLAGTTKIPEYNGYIERFHQDYTRNVWKKIDLPIRKRPTTPHRFSLRLIGRAESIARGITGPIPIGGRSL